MKFNHVDREAVTVSYAHVDADRVVNVSLAGGDPILVINPFYANNRRSCGVAVQIEYL